MYRVKSIETVFCYASLHKSSCSIIYIKNYASHYRADYPVVYHQNKYAKNCRPLLYMKEWSYPLKR